MQRGGPGPEVLESWATGAGIAENAAELWVECALPSLLSLDVERASSERWVGSEPIRHGLPRGRTERVDDNVLTGRERMMEQDGKGVWEEWNGSDRSSLKAGMVVSASEDMGIWQDVGAI